MCCVGVLVKQLIYYRVRKLVHFEISKAVEKRREKYSFVLSQAQDKEKILSRHEA